MIMFTDTDTYDARYRTTDTPPPKRGSFDLEPVVVRPPEFRDGDRR